MKLRTFIVCDDIRNEIGGKHSLIGTYRDRIIFSVNKQQVNSWPKSIRLAFFIEVDFDKKLSPRLFAFNMIEDGVTHELFKGGFSVNKDSKTIVLSLLHPSLKFKQAGIVNFELVFFDDKNKPVATLRPGVDFGIEERLVGE